MTPNFKYYQVTITQEYIDDKGKMKRIRETHLVDSPDTSGVEKRVAKAMEGCQYDWEITSIVLSKVSEVYGLDD